MEDRYKHTTTDMSHMTTAIRNASKVQNAPFEVDTSLEMNTVTRMPTTDTHNTGEESAPTGQGPAADKSKTHPICPRPPGDVISQVAAVTPLDRMTAHIRNSITHAQSKQRLEFEAEIYSKHACKGGVGDSRPFILETQNENGTISNSRRRDNEAHMRTTNMSGYGYKAIPAQPTIQCVARTITEAKLQPGTKEATLAAMEAQFQQAPTTHSDTQTWSSGATYKAATHEWGLIRHGTAGMVSKAWLSANARAWSWRACLSTPDEDNLPLTDTDGTPIVGDVSERFDARTTTGGRILELTVWGYTAEERYPATYSIPCDEEVTRPNMRVTTVYNCYTGATPPGEPSPIDAHSRPGMHASFDAALIAYCQQQDPAMWFVLDGDLNRMCCTQLAAWTTLKDDSNPQQWQDTLRDIAGIRPQEQHVLTSIMATGLIDAQTALHKQQLMGTGGWFPQLHQILLMRLDYILMNERARRSLMAEVTYHVEDAKKQPRHAQQVALTMACNQSDHAKRVIACDVSGERDSKQVSSIRDPTVLTGTNPQGWYTCTGNIRHKTDKRQDDESCTSPDELMTKQYSISPACRRRVAEGLTLAIIYHIVAVAGKCAMQRTITVSIAYQATSQCAWISRSIRNLLIVTGAIGSSVATSVSVLREQINEIRSKATTIHSEQRGIADHIPFDDEDTEVMVIAGAVVARSAEHSFSTLDAHLVHGCERIFERNSDARVGHIVNKHPGIAASNSNPTTACEMQYIAKATPNNVLSRMLRPVPLPLHQEMIQARAHPGNASIDTAVIIDDISKRYDNLCRVPSQAVTFHSRLHTARRYAGIDSDTPSSLPAPCDGCVISSDVDRPCEACNQSRALLANYDTRAHTLIQQISARMAYDTAGSGQQGRLRYSILTDTQYVDEADVLDTIAADMTDRLRALGAQCTRTLAQYANAIRIDEDDADGTSAAGAHTFRISTSKWYSMANKLGFVSTIEFAAWQRTRPPAGDKWRGFVERTLSKDCKPQYVARELVRSYDITIIAMQRAMARRMRPGVSPHVTLHHVHTSKDMATSYIPRGNKLVQHHIEGVLKHGGLQCDMSRFSNTLNFDYDMEIDYIKRQHQVAPRMATWHLGCGPTARALGVTLPIDAAEIARSAPGPKCECQHTWSPDGLPHRKVWTCMRQDVIQAIQILKGLHTPEATAWRRQEIFEWADRAQQRRTRRHMLTLQDDPSNRDDVYPRPRKSVGGQAKKIPSMHTICETGVSVEPILEPTSPSTTRTATTHSSLCTDNTTHANTTQRPVGGDAAEKSTTSQLMDALPVAALWSFSTAVDREWQSKTSHTTLRDNEQEQTLCSEPDILENTAHVSSDEHDGMKGSEADTAPDVRLRATLPPPRTSTDKRGRTSHVVDNKLSDSSKRPDMMRGESPAHDSIGSPHKLGSKVLNGCSPSSEACDPVKACELVLDENPAYVSTGSPHKLESKVLNGCSPSSEACDPVETCELVLNNSFMREDEGHPALSRETSPNPVHGTGGDSHSRMQHSVALQEVDRTCPDRNLNKGTVLTPRHCRDRDMGSKSQDAGWEPSHLRLKPTCNALLNPPVEDAALMPEDISPTDNPRIVTGEPMVAKAECTTTARDSNPSEDTCSGNSDRCHGGEGEVPNMRLELEQSYEFQAPPVIGVESEPEVQRNPDISLMDNPRIVTGEPTGDVRASALQGKDIERPLITSVPWRHTPKHKSADEIEIHPIGDHTSGDNTRQSDTNAIEHTMSEAAAITACPRQATDIATLDANNITQEAVPSATSVVIHLPSSDGVHGTTTTVVDAVSTTTTTQIDPNTVKSSTASRTVITQQVGKPTAANVTDENGATNALSDEDRLNAKQARDFRRSARTLCKEKMARSAWDAYEHQRKRKNIMVWTGCVTGIRESIVQDAALGNTKAITTHLSNALTAYMSIPLAHRGEKGMETIHVTYQGYIRKHDGQILVKYNARCEHIYCPCDIMGQINGSRPERVYTDTTRVDGNSEGSAALHPMRLIQRKHMNTNADERITNMKRALQPLSQGRHDEKYDIRNADVNAHTPDDVPTVYCFGGRRIRDDDMDHHIHVANAAITMKPGAEQGILDMGVKSDADSVADVSKMWENVRGMIENDNILQAHLFMRDDHIPWTGQEHTRPPDGQTMEVNIVSAEKDGHKMIIDLIKNPITAAERRDWTRHTDMESALPAYVRNRRLAIQILVASRGSTPVKVLLAIGPGGNTEGKRILVEALIDTGASCTLASSAIGKIMMGSCGGTYTPLPSDCTPICGSADGGLMRASGMSSFSVAMHSTRARGMEHHIDCTSSHDRQLTSGSNDDMRVMHHDVKAWVFDKLSVPLILGKDWLERLEADVKVSSNTLTFKDGEQTITYSSNGIADGDPLESNIHDLKLILSAETITVPPNGRHYLRAAMAAGQLPGSANDARRTIHIGDVSRMEKQYAIDANPDMHLKHPEKIECPLQQRRMMSSHELQQDRMGYIVADASGDGISASHPRMSYKVTELNNKVDGFLILVHNSSDTALRINAMQCVGHVIKACEDGVKDIVYQPEMSSKVSQQINADHYSVAAAVVQRVATDHPEEEIDDQDTSQYCGCAPIELLEITRCTHKNGASDTPHDDPTCKVCAQMEGSKLRHVWHARRAMRQHLQDISQLALNTDDKVSDADQQSRKRHTLILMIHLMDLSPWLTAPAIVMCEDAQKLILECEAYGDDSHMQQDVYAIRRRLSRRHQDARRGEILNTFPHSPNDAYGIECAAPDMLTKTWQTLFDTKQLGGATGEIWNAEQRECLRKGAHTRTQLVTYAHEQLRAQVHRRREQQPLQHDGLDAKRQETVQKAVTGARQECNLIRMTPNDTSTVFSIQAQNQEYTTQRSQDSTTRCQQYTDADKHVMLVDKRKMHECMTLDYDVQRCTAIDAPKMARTSTSTARDVERRRIHDCFNAVRVAKTATHIDMAGDDLQQAFLCAAVARSPAELIGTDDMHQSIFLPAAGENLDQKLQEDIADEIDAPDGDDENDNMSRALRGEEDAPEQASLDDLWYWSEIQGEVDEWIRQAWRKHRQAHQDCYVDPDNDATMEDIKTSLSLLSIPHPDDMADDETRADLLDFVKMLWQVGPAWYASDEQGAIKSFEAGPSFVQLVSNRVFAEPPRPIPASARSSIQTQIRQMLRRRIIEPSTSCWNSSVMVVPKKLIPGQPQGYRMVVDARGINAQLASVRWPMPPLCENLATAAGNRWLTATDVQDGFHAINLAPSLREITAFTPGDIGHYQYTRLPQGMACSMMVFCAVIQSLCGDLRHDSCTRERTTAATLAEAGHPRGNETMCSSAHKCGVCYYADDLTVFTGEQNDPGAAPGATLRDHMYDLAALASRLMKYNICCKSSKTDTARQSIKLLGFVCSERGVEMDTSKVKALATAERPETKEALQRWLGMAGFYRKFIPMMSQITASFRQILKQSHVGGKITQEQWDEAKCEASFQQIKRSLTRHTVLKPPDFSPNAGKMGLITDASRHAIGAVAFQETQVSTTELNGKGKPLVVESPIGWWSRTLVSAETRYSATARELIAIRDAVAAHRYMLWHVSFVLITDHCSLTAVMKPGTFSKTSSTRMYNLALSLQSLNCRIEHRSGRLIVPADFMSRVTVDDIGGTRPHNPIQDEEDVINDERLTKSQDDPEGIPRDYLLRRTPYVQGEPTPLGPANEQEEAEQRTEILKFCKTWEPAKNAYVSHEIGSTASKSDNPHIVTPDECREAWQRIDGKFAINEWGTVRHPERVDDDAREGHVSVYRVPHEAQGKYADKVKEPNSMSGIYEAYHGHKPVSSHGDEEQIIASVTNCPVNPLSPLIINKRQIAASVEAHAIGQQVAQIWRGISTATPAKQMPFSIDDKTWQDAIDLRSTCKDEYMHANCMYSTSDMEEDAVTTPTPGVEDVNAHEGTAVGSGHDQHCAHVAMAINATQDVDRHGEEIDRHMIDDMEVVHSINAIREQVQQADITAATNPQGAHVPGWNDMTKYDGVNSYLNSNTSSATCHIIGPAPMIYDDSAGISGMMSGFIEMGCVSCRGEGATVGMQRASATQTSDTYGAFVATYGARDTHKCNQDHPSLMAIEGGVPYLIVEMMSSDTDAIANMEQRIRGQASRKHQYVVESREMKSQQHGACVSRTRTYIVAIRSDLMNWIQQKDHPNHAMHANVPLHGENAPSEFEAGRQGVIWPKPEEPERHTQSVQAAIETAELLHDAPRSYTLDIMDLHEYEDMHRAQPDGVIQVKRLKNDTTSKGLPDAIYCGQGMMHDTSGDDAHSDGYYSLVVDGEMVITRLTGRQVAAVMGVKITPKLYQNLPESHIKDIAGESMAASMSRALARAMMIFYHPATFHSMIVANKDITQWLQTAHVPSRHHDDMVWQGIHHEDASDIMGHKWFMIATAKQSRHTPLMQRLQAWETGTPKCIQRAIKRIDWYLDAIRQKQPPNTRYTAKIHKQQARDCQLPSQDKEWCRRAWQYIRGRCPSSFPILISHDDTKRNVRLMCTVTRMKSIRSIPWISCMPQVMSNAKRRASDTCSNPLCQGNARTTSSQEGAWPCVCLKDQYKYIDTQSTYLGKTSRPHGTRIDENGAMRLGKRGHRQNGDQLVKDHHPMRCVDITEVLLPSRLSTKLKARGMHLIQQSLPLLRSNTHMRNALRVERVRAIIRRFKTHTGEWSHAVHPPTQQGMDVPNGRKGKGRRRNKPHEYDLYTRDETMGHIAQVTANIRHSNTLQVAFTQWSSKGTAPRVRMYLTMAQSNQCVTKVNASGQQRRQMRQLARDIMTTRDRYGANEARSAIAWMNMSRQATADTTVAEDIATVHMVDAVSVAMQGIQCEMKQHEHTSDRNHLPVPTSSAIQQQLRDNMRRWIHIAAQHDIAKHHKIALEGNIDTCRHHLTQRTVTDDISTRHVRKMMTTAEAILHDALQQQTRTYLERLLWWAHTNNGVQGYDADKVNTHACHAQTIRAREVFVQDSVADVMRKAGFKPTARTYVAIRVPDDHDAGYPSDMARTHKCIWDTSGDNIGLTASTRTSENPDEIDFFVNCGMYTRPTKKPKPISAGGDMVRAGAITTYQSNGTAPHDPPITRHVYNAEVAHKSEHCLSIGTHMRVCNALGMQMDNDDEDMDDDAESDDDEEGRYMGTVGRWWRRITSRAKGCINIGGSDTKILDKMSSTAVYRAEGPNTATTGKDSEPCHLHKTFWRCSTNKKIKTKAKGPPKKQKQAKKKLISVQDAYTLVYMCEEHVDPPEDTQPAHVREMWTRHDSGKPKFKECGPRICELTDDTQANESSSEASEDDEGDDTHETAHDARARYLDWITKTTASTDTEAKRRREATQDILLRTDDDGNMFIDKDHTGHELPRQSKLLGQEQRKCMETKQIIDMVEHKATIPDSLMRHSIQQMYGDITQYFCYNDVLYKKRIVGKSKRLEDDMLQGSYPDMLVVVPTTLRYALLQIAHDSSSTCHASAKVMTDILSAKFCWPYMQRDISWYCATCDVCQRIKRLNTPIKPVKRVVECPHPGCVIQADIWGPCGANHSKHKAGGYRYILSVVEAFSKHVWFRPLKTNDSESVGSALLSYMCGHGFPRVICTGNDTQLVSHAVAYMNEHLGIHSSASTAYHPQSIGLVERSHHTMVDKLISQIGKEQDLWPEKCDAVAWAINQCPNRSTRMAPNALRFGTLPEQPFEVTFAPPPKNVTDATKHTAKLVQSMHMAQQEVERRMSDYRRKTIQSERTQNKLTRGTHMTKGTQVLIHIPSAPALISSTLNHRFHGPYIINEHDASNDRYLISEKDVPESRKQYIKSNRIRQYKTRETDTDILYQTADKASLITSSILLFSSLKELKQEIESGNARAESTGSIDKFHSMIMHARDDDGTMSAIQKAIEEVRKSVNDNLDEDGEPSELIPDEWDMIFMHGEKPPPHRQRVPVHTAEYQAGETQGTIPVGEEWSYTSSNGETGKVIRKWLGRLAPGEVELEDGGKVPDTILTPGTRIIIKKDISILQKPHKLQGKLGRTRVLEQHCEVTHIGEQQACKEADKDDDKRYDVANILLSMDRATEDAAAEDHRPLIQQHYLVKWAKTGGNKKHTTSWEPSACIGTALMDRLFGLPRTVSCGPNSNRRMLKHEHWADDDVAILMKLVEDGTWPHRYQLHTPAYIAAHKCSAVLHQVCGHADPEAWTTAQQVVNAAGIASDNMSDGQDNNDDVRWQRMESWYDRTEDAMVIDYDSDTSYTQSDTSTAQAWAIMTTEAQEEVQRVRAEREARNVNTWEQLRVTGEAYEDETREQVTHDAYADLLVTIADNEHRAERKDKTPIECPIVWDEITDEPNDPRFATAKLSLTVAELAKMGIDAHKEVQLQIVETGKDSDRKSYKSMIYGDGAQHSKVKLRVQVRDDTPEEYGLIGHVSVTEIQHVDPTLRAMWTLPAICQSHENNGLFRQLCNQRDIAVTTAEIMPPTGVTHRDLLGYDLNEGQATAVTKMLVDDTIVACMGPGGTGKSAVAVCAIIQAALNGKRVLVTAASNTACDVLAMRIKEAIARATANGLDMTKAVAYRANARTRQYSPTLPYQIRCMSLFEHAKALMFKANSHSVTRCIKIWQHRIDTGSFENAEKAMQFENQVKRFEADIIGSDATTILIATCSSLGSARYKAFKGNVLFCDEAATVSEVDSTVALSAFATDEHSSSLRQITLIGDVAQLPPCLLSPYAKQKVPITSWLERLWIMNKSEPTSISAASSVSCVQLQIQHRSHPAIVEWANQFVYNASNVKIPGLVPLDTATGIEVSRTADMARLRMCDDDSANTWPIAWFDTKGCEHESVPNSGYFNRGEAKVVCTLVRTLLKAGYTADDIGIISPYQRQKALIKESLTASASERAVTVSSVDGLQGQELKIIIISTTRTSGYLPFVKDMKRTCVALGRARSAVFFVGDIEGVCKEWKDTVNKGLRDAYERITKAWFNIREQLAARKQIHPVEYITQRLVRNEPQAACAAMTMRHSNDGNTKSMAYHPPHDHYGVPREQQHHDGEDTGIPRGLACAIAKRIFVEQGHTTAESISYDPTITSMTANEFDEYIAQQCTIVEQPAHNGIPCTADMTRMVRESKYWRQQYDEGVRAVKRSINQSNRQPYTSNTWRSDWEKEAQKPDTMHMRYGTMISQLIHPPDSEHDANCECVICAQCDIDVRDLMKSTAGIITRYIHNHKDVRYSRILKRIQVQRAVMDIVVTPAYPRDTHETGKGDHQKARTDANGYLHPFSRYLPVQWNTIHGKCLCLPHAMTTADVPEYADMDTPDEQRRCILGWEAQQFVTLCERCDCKGIEAADNDADDATDVKGHLLRDAASHTCTCDDTLDGYSPRDTWKYMMNASETMAAFIQSIASNCTCGVRLHDAVKSILTAGNDPTCKCESNVAQWQQLREQLDMRCSKYDSADVRKMVRASPTDLGRRHISTLPNKWLDADDMHEIYDMGELLHRRVNNYTFEGGIHRKVHPGPPPMVRYPTLKGMMPFNIGYGLPAYYVPNTLSPDLLDDDLRWATHQYPGIILGDTAEFIADNVTPMSNEMRTGMKKKSIDLLRHMCMARGNRPVHKGETARCNAIIQTRDDAHIMHTRARAHHNSDAWQAIVTTDKIQLLMNICDKATKTQGAEQQHHEKVVTADVEAALRMEMEREMTTGEQLQTVGEGWPGGWAGEIIHLRDAILAATSYLHAWYMGAACRLTSDTTVPNKTSHSSTVIDVGPGTLCDPNHVPGQPIGENEYEPGYRVRIQRPGDRYGDVGIVSRVTHGSKPVEVDSEWYGANADELKVLDKVDRHRCKQYEKANWIQWAARTSDRHYMAPRMTGIAWIIKSKKNEADHREHHRKQDLAKQQTNDGSC